MSWRLVARSGVEAREARVLFEQDAPLPADIAVIGNFTGELRTVAVAAVGTNSSIISLIVNLFIGIALGANVTIAHAIGEKNDTMVHHAVHTSIVVRPSCGGRPVSSS